jgi:hypothetical protein
VCDEQARMAHLVSGAVHEAATDARRAQDLVSNEGLHYTTHLLCQVHTRGTRPQVPSRMGVTRVTGSGGVG